MSGSFLWNRGIFLWHSEHMDKAKALLDSLCRYSVLAEIVQLVQLQYYTRTKEYDKSIALIDEVTSVVLKSTDAWPYSLKTFILNDYKHLQILIRVILTELLKPGVT